MAIELKIKEKHYKNSRFGNKSEKELAEFKKQGITQDLEELKAIALENLDFYYQLMRKKDKIKIPKKNSVLAIRTQSQINAFEIFLQFIDEFGSIDFLSLQSYTFNEKTLASLNELMNDGKIKKLQIIMTETASFRIPKIYKMLKDLFSERKDCNLCFYWVHSKVHLLEAKGNKYVIDGSGNFSMNAQVEQYNIFNSPKLFDFDFNFCNDFFFGEKLRKKHEIYKNF